MGDGRYSVEVASTIAAKNHVSRLEVLDRKTRGVKFKRTITSIELMKRKRITNKLFKVKLDVSMVRIEARDVTGICVPLPTIIEGAAGE